MKKGIVMETARRYVVVLTPDGEFLKVPQKGKIRVGEEIELVIPSPFHRRRFLTSVSGLTAAAIAGFLVLSGLGWFGGMDPVAAYVSLDINPSVELGVDAHDQVVEADGLNADGIQLIQGVVYKHKPLQEVTAELIAKADAAHYLDQTDSDIVVTSTVVRDRSGITDQKLTKEVQSQIQKVVESDQKQHKNKPAHKVTVTSIAAPKTLRDEAKAEGISTGKLAVQLLISQEDKKTIPLAELKSKSISDIAKAYGGIGHLIHTGTPVTKEELQTLLQQSLANRKKDDQKQNKQEQNKQKHSTQHQKNSQDQQQNAQGKRKGPINQHQNPDPKESHGSKFDHGGFADRLIPSVENWFRGKGRSAFEHGNSKGENGGKPKTHGNNRNGNGDDPGGGNSRGDNGGSNVRRNGDSQINSNSGGSDDNQNGGHVDHRGDAQGGGNGNGKDRAVDRGSHGNGSSRNDDNRYNDGKGGIVGGLGGILQDGGRQQSSRQKQHNSARRRYWFPWLHGDSKQQVQDDNKNKTDGGSNAVDSHVSPGKTDASGDQNASKSESAKDNPSGNIRKNPKGKQKPSNPSQDNGKQENRSLKQEDHHANTGKRQEIGKQSGDSQQPKQDMRKNNDREDSEKGNELNYKDGETHQSSNVSDEQKSDPVMQRIFHMLW